MFLISLRDEKIQTAACFKFSVCFFLSNLRLRGIRFWFVSLPAGNANSQLRKLNESKVSVYTQLIHRDKRVSFVSPSLRSVTASSSSSSATLGTDCTVLASLGWVACWWPPAPRWWPSRTSYRSATTLAPFYTVRPLLNLTGCRKLWSSLQFPGEGF